MKWPEDIVTISDEAKKRFQKMCDDEIARRNPKDEVEVEIINVEIKQESGWDYMLYFFTGTIATLSVGTLGYLLGKLIF